MVPPITPAPAPSSNSSGACVSRLAALAQMCPSFVAQVTAQAGNIPENATDAMVMEQVSSQAKPTPQCCIAVQGFLKPACYCDESVLRVLSGQGIGAAELRTVMRAAMYGCDFAKSILGTTC
ncbi:hypothetical protein WJX81_003615 [Elliptochloris bilobata]|uniref:Bifunctional inhibitor/plant lipid transfer protein/seed storage helical domain-containing protein n=1 Tax=Elliptochloris bilobata TaxID=381761 RepID=A0AAW1RCK3_9CHLO